MRQWRRLARRYPDRFIVVEGQWFPILAGGGPGKTSTTSTTVVNIPPASAEEKALQAKQVELMDLQIQEARRQSKLLEESFPATGELLKQQLALTTDLVSFQRRQMERQEVFEGRQQVVEERRAVFEQRQAERQEVFEERLLKGLEQEPIVETPQQQEIRALSEAQALRILKGEAEPLSPQQEQFINEQFGEAARVAKGELRQFAEELATTRGLNLTDTPIGDVALREAGNVAASLAGARATAKLDVSRTQQAFQESVRQFQEGLRQQAFLNRLALTGRESPSMAFAVGGAPGLLANAGAAVPGTIAALNPALARMQGERIAGASTSTRGSAIYSPGFFDYFSATMQAVGAAAGAFAGAKSSERFKRDIEPLDVDEYERARLKVKAVPVVRFAYNWDGPEARKHLGIVIETSPEEVSRDGLTLDMPGYVGLTLAALKGVDRRVDRLEARLPIPHPGRRGARLPIPARAA